MRCLASCDPYLCSQTSLRALLNGIGAHTSSWTLVPGDLDQFFDDIPSYHHTTWIISECTRKRSWESDDGLHKIARQPPRTEWSIKKAASTICLKCAVHTHTPARPHACGHTHTHTIFKRDQDKQD